MMTNATLTYRITHTALFARLLGQAAPHPLVAILEHELRDGPFAQDALVALFDSFDDFDELAREATQAPILPAEPKKQRRERQPAAARSGGGEARGRRGRPKTAPAPTQSVVHTR